MRPVILIAWREYKQYVLSRGFLMFLVMFPLIVLLGAGAIGFIESSRPTRAFVVIDGAGGYADAIDQEIDRQQRRAALSAWDLWVAAALDPAKMTAKDLPAPFAPDAVTFARIERSRKPEASRPALRRCDRRCAPAFPFSGRRKDSSSALKPAASSTPGFRQPKRSRP